MRRDLRVAVRAIRDDETRRAFEFLTDEGSELSSLRQRVEALENQNKNDGSFEPGTFTKVDPRVVEYNPSGTAGDGTYQAASTVDFSSSVAAGAKKVYLYVKTLCTNIDVSSPWFGFTWKPTGWTDTLEEFHIVYPDGDLEDHRNLCLPLSDALTVDIAVVKCDNGVGEAWSYSFEVWGYE